MSAYAFIIPADIVEKANSKCRHNKQLKHIELYRDAGAVYPVYKARAYCKNGAMFELGVVRREG